MNVFLIGYYGFGNCGDDVCLKKSKEVLRHVFSNVTFFILHQYKNKTKGWVKRSNFFSVLNAIWKSDRIVFGGGTLFQNLTSSLSLYYYLSFIWLGALLGKDIFF